MIDIAAKIVAISPVVFGSLVFYVLRNNNIREICTYPYNGLRFIFCIFALAISPVIFLVCVNSIRAIDPVDAAIPSKYFRLGSGLTCDMMLATAFRLVEGDSGNESTNGNDRSLVCPVQTIVNDGKSQDVGVPEHDCWPISAINSGQAARKRQIPNCYRMAFLEFARDGRLPRLQAKMLGSAIGNWKARHRGKEIYAIFYVHGWRHDARLGDTDVRRLRTVASYASGQLNERCRETGEHCGALVLAIYMSWPGNVGLFDDGSAIAAPFNALTFPGRKRLSDKMGAPIMEVVSALSELIRSNSPESSKSPESSESPEHRVLLIGHSLGGNALLTAIEPKLIAAMPDVAL